MVFDDLEFQHNATGMNSQAIVFFPNGYGASVIIGPYTYGGDEGLYEIAVLRGERGESSLCYDTPVTDDVLGYLTEADVTETLAKIEALPPHPLARREER
jgi:hypothetical protein